jgi:hypothetical protein
MGADRDGGCDQPVLPFHKKISVGSIRQPPSRNIMSASTPNVKVLVLDAGPLLSLTPLRGLSERYVTVPHVIAELKDKRAREYFERLAITSGMNVEILSPDVLSLAKGSKNLSLRGPKCLYKSM